MTWVYHRAEDKCDILYEPDCKTCYYLEDCDLTRVVTWCLKYRPSQEMINDPSKGKSYERT